MVWGLLGSSVHGILQARILEWVAVSFPGDLPNPGIEHGSPTVQADSLSSLFIWVCYFINQFIELFKQLNFLEQFNLTTKLRTRYRDFLCTPCPHTCIASLNMRSWPERDICYSWCTCTDTPSPRVCSLEFMLGIVHSVGFDKQMRSIRHFIDSITWNSY